MTRRGHAECDERFSRWRRPWIGLVGALVLVGVSGCFPPDEGLDPDQNGPRIYFPTGLALSPVEDAPECPDPTAAEKTHKWLYVANSDFDLQYNAGSVQVFDLDMIDEVVTALNLHAPNPEDRCPKELELFRPAPDKPGQKFSGGKKSPSDQFTSPGLCNAFPTDPLIKAHVKIGAFATDIRYLKRPSDQAANGSTSDMLVVPVRGDDTLHWLDTDPTSDGGANSTLLDCGADENGFGKCDGNHRRGDNASEDNTRSAELPREPFGIAADVRGEAIVTTHQSDGALALFVNDWTKVAPEQKGPHLQFVLQDAQNIPTGAVGVASIPEPDVVLALRGTNSSMFYEPGYYATYRNAAKISLIRYFSDQGEFKNPDLDQTYPGRAFLEFVNDSPVLVNSQGFDSRGVAIDGAKRHNCECACSDKPGPATCRTDCVDAPLDLPAGSLVDANKTAKCDPNATPPGECADYVKCLRGCSSTSLDVFVSNRTPPTLIVGKTFSSSGDVPGFYDTEQVSAGPSRVVTGSVRVPDGKGGTRPSARVFVICFDSRAIFVYDPKGSPGRFESVIHTGRGPHSLVVDEARGKGYVGHFTDSYIGVIDLDQSHVDTYGSMVLTIGQPTAPRAQK